MLTCHFTIGNEKQSRMSFSDAQIIRKEKYLPLLSTVNLPLVEFVHIFTHFDKSTYKFGTVYTLAYRFCRICSNCTKLNADLVCLTNLFLKNGHPENFINKCLKRFMDNKRD